MRHQLHTRTAAAAPPEEDMPEEGLPVEDGAYPPPEESEESSFWQDILDFFSQLLARFSTPVSAHSEPVKLAIPKRSYAIAKTIIYDYDNLYRLTAADYSDGTYFHYQYDAVGNREVMTTTGEVVTNYVYDDANRLISAGGVAYAWDDNGNLLNDGVYTYIYSTDNRLISISNQQSTIENHYNGLGDRLRQTLDGVTTNYAIDTAAGLTQVLSDGTNSYLYGIGRIGEEQPEGWLYHHGDALGSVRQLTDETEEVKLARNYEPYGDNLSTAGNASSVYQFTGEMRDPTKLIYLRARYIDSGTGRFTTRDIWQGDYAKPLSLNGWNYVLANPINFTDPSGQIPALSSNSLNPYDLTYWLYSELSANSNGYYVRTINSLTRKNVPPHIYGRNWLTGANAWILLVKDRAKWDFKHEIRISMGGKSIILHDERGYNWYEYSIPGNIHFGFVGRAAGFSGFELHGGAGYAEITDPAHDEAGECCPKFCTKPNPPKICETIGCHYVRLDWWKSLFDDPADWWNVEFGIRLYDMYKEGLTLAQFESFLATNGHWLTHASYIPSSWRASASDWPYTVERFDGPDTAKNQPELHAIIGEGP